MLKTSIITISFNQDKFLEECIRSVISQSGDIEYIVIDGGSTDRSTQILQEYSDRITYWVSEPDCGPTDALLKGFSRATGDVCCYLNSDDRFTNDSIARVQREFAANPTADVIYGDSSVIDAEGNIVDHLISTRKFSSYRYLVHSTMVCQPSTFFRRSVYEESGGFSRENSTCWDGELLMQMYKVGATFMYLPEVLSDFRVHEGSISGSGRMRYEYEAYRRVLFERERNRKLGVLDKAAALGFKIEDYPRRFLRRRQLSHLVTLVQDLPR